MLYIITGNVQVGKTRWLDQGVQCARSAGIFVCGATAPGVWQQADDADSSAGGSRFSRSDDGILREKLGIDNMLWPQGRRIAFARRADLAGLDVLQGSCRQNDRAKLEWAIDDDAIAQVNNHFRDLRSFLADAAPGNGIVAVDELGRLELLAGGGLTEAVALLSHGPYPACPTAVVVVRESLVAAACGMLSSVWDIEVVDSLSREAQDAVFGLSSVRGRTADGRGGAE
jgi:hypothetical protein